MTGLPKEQLRSTKLKTGLAELALSEASQKIAKPANISPPSKPAVGSAHSVFVPISTYTHKSVS